MSGEVAENWLMIYAEGIMRRYANDPFKTTFASKVSIISAAKSCNVIFSNDDLDEAVECAVRAYECDPQAYSSYSINRIGQMLKVTLKERTEFAYHLGCFEETNAEREARRRLAKIRQRAAAGATPRGESLSKQKPWEAQGISRSSWYRKRDQARETNTAPNIRSKNITLPNLSHSRRSPISANPDTSLPRVGDGFYEWLRTNGGTKVPYRMSSFAMRLEETELVKLRLAKHGEFDWP